MGLETRRGDGISIDFAGWGGQLVSGTEAVGSG